MSRVKLGDVVFRAKEFVDKDNTSLQYYIGGEHFEYGQVCITKKGEIKGSTIGPAFHMKFMPGDVLLMSRNPHLRKAGVVDFEGICSDVSYVCRTRDEKVLLQRYLPFIFQTDDFWNYAEEHKHGSTNFFLNWKDFETYEFELPEIEQQRELTALLWAAQDTKQSYIRLIEQTDALVKSQFIEMFGDPNSCDNSVKLTEAFEIRDDLRKPLNDSVRSGMRTGTLYSYYGANGQVDSINEYITEYNALCMAEDCGAYGAGEASSYIISGKAWVNNHAHVLVPRSNCNIVYANEYFRLLDITKLINGSTRSKLTQDAMKKLPVVLPPRVEQDKFAMFVEQSDKSKYCERKMKMIQFRRSIQEVQNNAE